MTGTALGTIPGQIAYDAYCQALGNNGLTTDQMLPTFENLQESNRQVWVSVEQAVRQYGATGGGNEHSMIPQPTF